MGVEIITRTTSTTLGDPWETLIKPYSFVDEAIEVLEPCLVWHEQYRADLLNGWDDGPEETLNALPSHELLAEMGMLFRQAEIEPAPESWAHVAVGLMLASEPANGVHGEAYRGAIADALYRSRSVREGYRPGMSAPVIIAAIRDARLEGELPSPGLFIKLCQRHRRHFGEWAHEIGALTKVLAKAEAEVKAIAYHTASEPQKLARRWRRPYVDDPGDVPF